jgi:hypothetical protein
MENLLSTTSILLWKVFDVTAERGIHAAVFVLLIVGMFTITGRLSYRFVSEVPLMIASIALSWGITLLVLYVAFRKLNWRWWE